MKKHKIAWTEATWNPVTGCSKVSPGCEHCYAERMALRLKAMGQEKYRNGFGVTEHEDVLEVPLRWKKGRMVFVCSMSDLFHEEVSEGFREEVFRVICKADQHTFQVLTKRAWELGEVWYPVNAWMGVSVENAKCVYRIDFLRRTGSVVRFVSFEPLLGPVGKLDLKNIGWVIVGGESGPGAREMKAEWVRDIRDQCVEADVPFFFKQWGGVNKKKAGRILDGRVWDQMPGR